MKRILLIITMLLLLCGCESESKKATIQKIDCNKKDELVAEGATLIDVRESNEYSVYHLDKAINIDYRELNNRKDELPEDKEQKIIVYCKSGTRSDIAANTLIDMGYKNIYDMGSINNCEN